MAAAALPGGPAFGGGHSAPNLVLPGLVLPDAFLKMPLHERDATGISEGHYLGSERHVSGGGHDMLAGVIGRGLHESLDVPARRGASILAPAAGVAFRTYQSWLSNTVHTRDGHTGRIGYGLGMWLLILHKIGDQYWWSKIAHCAWIDPSIYYLQPYVDSDGDWHEPGSLYVPDPILFGLGTPVEQGQRVAEVGDTGVEWFDPATGRGWRDDFDVVTGQVRPRDWRVKPPWDDRSPQIHYEFYRRFLGSPGPGEELDARRISVDITGIYGQVRPDHNPYAGWQTAPGRLVLTDRHGRALFAG